jgi:flavin reductase (DIM6/NTAB) family NADH-FMN oxidoreductase RutF
MQSFHHADINALEQRFRARLINSLSGFKSANLIGTQSSDQQQNLAIVSSVVHLGANPALVGLVMRPNTVPRDTFANILDTGSFTINQVSSEFWQAAHQTSARYASAQSEFELVGLTAEIIDDFNAPFVAESQLKYGVKLVDVLPIAANNTEFIIGEICQIHIANKAIKSDGYIDIESLNTVAVSGLDSYHLTDRLSRLSYAKPEKPLQTLTVDGLYAEQHLAHLGVITD